MKRNILFSLTISGVCLFTYYFLNDEFFNGGLHRFFPTLTIYFFLQSILIFWLVDLAAKEEWKNPIYLLGAITLRFILGLFGILILYTLDQEHLKPLLLQFVCLYLGYLIFELFAVLPNLRRN